MVFAWLGISYLLMIFSTDVLIVFFTIRLFKSETPEAGIRPPYRDGLRIAANENRSNPQVSFFFFGEQVITPTDQRTQGLQTRCKSQSPARMKGMSAHLASIASPISAKSNRYRRCIHNAVSNPNPRWSARRDHATCESHTIGLHSNSLGRMPSAAKPATIA